MAGVAEAEGQCGEKAGWLRWQAFSEFGVRGSYTIFRHMEAIFEGIAEAGRKGQPVALVTVVRARGSVPRHEGSKMLVYPDGSILGSVGGGEMEARAIAEALAALKEGRPRLVDYTLVNPKEGDPGICGGEVTMFVDPLIPPPTLLIVGAGHVGRAVAFLGRWLGFRIVIYDDRPDYATSEAVADADRRLTGPLDEALKDVQFTPDTYIVAVTRSYPMDVALLRQVLDVPAAYIGIMGSRRRVLEVFKALRDEGVPEEKLARVHGPIGLELNAETPEEIAVSILGEIIMLRRGGSGEPMKMMDRG